MPDRHASRLVRSVVVATVSGLAACKPAPQVEPPPPPPPPVAASPPPSASSSPLAAPPSNEAPLTRLPDPSVQPPPADSDEPCTNDCVARIRPNGAICAPHSKQLLPGNDFTVELWAKLDGSDGLVWNKWVDSREDKQLKVLGAELQAFVVGRSAQSKLVASRPAREAWHHLAVSYDGSVHRFFVDGALRASTKVGFRALDADGELCFGQNARRGWAGADMLVGDVRISTAARYREDFQPATSLRTDASTRALWRFGEMSEQGDVADESGNGHEAKVRGEVGRVRRR